MSIIADLQRTAPLACPSGTGSIPVTQVLFCRLLAAVLFLGLLAGSARAAEPSPLSATALSRLTFDQKLNTQLNLDLPFTDETGQPVRLRDYFGHKPVILDLGYYECPMLCSLVLNGLIESLQSVDGSIGKDFDVLCVSISPTETPALAAAKKRNYVRLYSRRGAAAGWHFLTGREPAIRALAGQVGFHYVYAPTVKQYAHPSGLVIITPEGKVAKYFFGVSYSPHELQAALRGAAVRQVGSPVQRLLILCCSFMPLIGKHSATIMLLVRIAALGVLFWLIGYIIRTARGPSRTSPQPALAAGETAQVGRAVPERRDGARQPDSTGLAAAGGAPGRSALPPEPSSLEERARP